MNTTRVGHAGSQRARRYKLALEGGDTQRELPAIIETLQILPTQVGNRRALYDKPEAELWLAAGIQGIHDYLELKSFMRREQKEAAQWLFSENEEPRSFRWLCDLFEVDVDAARDKLRKARAMMIEHRRAGRYLRSA